MFMQKRTVEIVKTTQALLKSASTFADKLSTEDALSVLKDVEAVNTALTGVLADVKKSIDSDDVDFICATMQKAHNSLHNAQRIESKAAKAYAQTLRA